MFLMLLRLPYLALSSVVTLIRLWPMSEKDKDAEILVLCQGTLLSPRWRTTEVPAGGQ